MKYIFPFFLIAQVTTSFCQTGEWTWMNGTNLANQLGVFGTQGVPSPANTPPALYEACEWMDKQGNFWLFGGLSLYDVYGDMWKFDPSTNEWTWMKGTGQLNPIAQYGTQGIPDPSNTPGGRSWGMASWVDTSGNFWLTGGLSPPLYGESSDLWKYDPGTNEWTWVKGPSSSNNPGTYGSIGVPSPLNNPGGRSETAAAWTDENNNLWLFGGHGYDFSFQDGLLNDLWKYDIAANEWTWMKGANTVNPPASYGTMGIPAATNTPGGRMAYCRWKDIEGNLWLFGGGDYSGTNYYFNDLWQYNPSTSQWTWMNGSNFQNNSGIYPSSFCTPDSNHYPTARFENRSALVDDKCTFWMWGGAKEGDLGTTYGDLWHYNPSTNEFTLVHGSNSVNTAGSYGTLGVSSPSNYPLSRGGSVSWQDQSGNLWMFGGWVTYFSNQAFHNDLWRYAPDPACPVITALCSNTSQNAFSASDTNLCQKFCINFFDSSTNNPTAWQWLFPGGNPASSTDQNPTNICYNNPGIYDVTLITTSVSGNDTTTFYGYITVYSTPPFPTITQNGYTLTSSPALSYQWQFNSVDIPGATNQSYTIPQTGYYTVFITDSNGCSSSTTVYVLIDGIENSMTDLNVSIFPNPSSGSFTVQLLNGLIGQNVLLRITNSLGQEVFSAEEKITQAEWKKEVDLSNESQGIYTIEIKITSDFVRKKIIVAN